MNYEQQGRAVAKILKRYHAGDINAQQMIDEQNALMPPCDMCAKPTKVRLHQWMLCEACYARVVKIAGVRPSEYEVSGAMQVLVRAGHTTSLPRED
jgi:hypothetical protein